MKWLASILGSVTGGGWLTVAKLLLSLVDGIIRYAGDRQLISAGEAQAVAAGLRQSHEAIARAQAARRAVDHSPDSVRDDKYNRD